METITAQSTIFQSIAVPCKTMKNTLFFALVGPNNDAHIYISNLIEKGVQNFVVTHIPEGLSNKATFLVVENTLDALQKYAAYHRSLFKFPSFRIDGK